MFIESQISDRQFAMAKYFNIFFAMVYLGLVTIGIIGASGLANGGAEFSWLVGGAMVLVGVSFAVLHYHIAMRLVKPVSNNDRLAYLDRMRPIWAEKLH